jgi:serine/threonine protein kinase
MTLPRSLTQLGRYRIVREIGRGSMGRVYLANDPNIDRQIALKVLAPVGGLGQREELHRRFLAETRAAGKLNHTHIVTVYDAEVDAETSLPYIAMEWVEGRSLEEELRLRGPSRRRRPYCSLPLLPRKRTSILRRPAGTGIDTSTSLPTGGCGRRSRFRRGIFV